MKKITIIYWSGTGNTEKMANAIKKGIEVDAIVKLLEVEKATKEHIIDSDIIALGCPAMGDEILEEEHMEPFVSSLENIDLKEKTIALFGSYGGGNGKWMRNWVERMKKCCPNIINEGLIIHRDTIDENLIRCENLGKELSNC